MGDRFPIFSAKELYPPYAKVYGLPQLLGILFLKALLCFSPNSVKLEFALYQATKSQL
jgi:hypothetical protein